MTPKAEAIEEAPFSLVGAPNPRVLADEHRVVLLYYTVDDYDKAICVFDHCFEFRMGMPSEDWMTKSSLFSYGVEAFGAYWIDNSPWLAELQARYGVITDFSIEGRKYRHYVFSFHDRCFECISSGLEVHEIKDQRKISETIDELPRFLETPRSEQDADDQLPARTESKAE